MRAVKARVGLDDSWVLRHLQHDEGRLIFLSGRVVVLLARRDRSDCKCSTVYPRLALALFQIAFLVLHLVSWFCRVRIVDIFQLRIRSRPTGEELELMDQTLAGLSDLFVSRC